MDGSAYRRRKLHGNTIVLPPEENTSYITTTQLIIDNCILSSDDDHFTEIEDKRNLLISGQHCLSSSVELVPNFIPAYLCIIRGNFEKEHIASLDGSCSSEGNVECSLAPVDMKRLKRARESSDAVKGTHKNLRSPKGLVIGYLKSHGMLGRERDSSTHCSELQNPNDPIRSLPCKICGRLENPSELLICDTCEEGFHLSCCGLKEDEVPIGDWNCQTCLEKEPTLSSGRSSNTSDGEASTGVAIGDAYQAEVASWSGPSSIDHDYFGAEMDLPAAPTRHDWYYRKSTSIGNWVQCQEEVHKDKKTLCGRWRRAPLNVTQTDFWNCYSAVTWDPIHADCAVPQELPTSEVQKQLRFLRTINGRLAAGTLQKVEGPHAAERLQQNEDSHAVTGTLHKDKGPHDPRSGDSSGEGQN